MSSIVAILSTAICLFYSNEYFRLFDIEFFAFSGISDAYYISISKGAILPALIFSFLIAIWFSFVLFIFKGLSKDRDRDVRKITHPVVGVLILISGVTLSLFAFTYMLMSVWLYQGIFPEQQAKTIRIGHAARYNIMTDNVIYSCHSIISGTSSYLFLWDFSNKRPKIISRSKITYLDQVVPKAPEPSLPAQEYRGWGGMERRTPDLEYAILKEKHLQIDLAWSTLLKKECSQ